MEHNDTILQRIGRRTRTRNRPRHSCPGMRALVKTNNNQSRILIRHGNIHHSRERLAFLGVSRYYTIFLLLIPLSYHRKVEKKHTIIGMQGADLLLVHHLFFLSSFFFFSDWSLRQLTPAQAGSTATGQNSAHTQGYGKAWERSSDKTRSRME